MVIPQLLPGPLAFASKPFSSMVGKMLRLDEMQSLWAEAGREGETGPALARKVLEKLQIDVAFDSEEFSRIPPIGPVIIVCNHPTGFLEGLILMSLLPTIRRDFKFLTNKMLAGASQMTEYMLPVDVSGRSVQANGPAMSSALNWLRQGGLLVIFPAGAVSTWNWKQGKSVDPNWNNAAARLAILTGANTVPIYFNGATSAAFQIAGAIHPSLRIARMPAELLLKRGARMDVRVAHSISARRLKEVEGLDNQTGFLRAKTYLLALKKSLPANLPALVEIEGPSVSVAELLKEIKALPKSQVLEEHSDLVAYVARARQIPAVLTEIGRLREETFRNAGEGTGQAKDIDTFDASYEHIFLWHCKRCEIVGSYRLAKTTCILPEQGVQGLYTSTLFRYDAKFFQHLGPAVELGRSFVRLEYQKEYAPLLVLWKAICKFVARDPQHAILFGAVSISKEYNTSTRSLIVEWLRQHSCSEALKGLASARHPYGIRGEAEILRFAQSASSLEGLSEAVAEIDPQGKGLPVLLRHYLKLGGVAVAFHIDMNFAGVLDVLFLVDLRKADSTSIRRFMGEEEYRSFCDFHRETKSAGIRVTAL